MKLLDLFADKLLETRLMEMAMERKLAIKRVESLEDKLNEHIIKYLYFNDRARNHWLNEIDAYLSKIDNVLISKIGKLESKVYYRILFEDFYGHGTIGIEKLINPLVKGKYSQSPRSGLSISQIHWCMKQFYIWICPELANNSLIVSQNPNELKNKVLKVLDELQEKARKLN